MLCYIHPGSLGVKKVSVMKVWCWEIRKECVFLRSGWSFLWLIFQFRIVFWIIMWWFFSFGFLVWRQWHCFFQGSGMLEGVNCLYCTPEYCSSCILDKDAVKKKGETVLVQVHYLRGGVCVGSPAVTTLDNNRTSRFWILDNRFG